MKLLKDLIYGVRLKEVIGSTQIAIESICYDSRKAAKNSLFVAVPGTQVDGHLFIDKAVELGAIAIICERLRSALLKESTTFKLAIAPSHLALLQRTGTITRLRT